MRRLARLLGTWRKRREVLWVAYCADCEADGGIFTHDEKALGRKVVADHLRDNPGHHVHLITEADFRQAEYLEGLRRHEQLL